MHFNSRWPDDKRCKHESQSPGFAVPSRQQLVPAEAGWSYGYLWGRGLRGQCVA